MRSNPIDISKAYDTMKLHIKEQLRKISYPETMNLRPLSNPVKTKGAHKKVKLTYNNISRRQSPSYFEHVLALENHLLHHSYQKSYTLKRCRFLCTNTLNGL